MMMMMRILSCTFQMTYGQQNTEKEAHDILSYTFDQGINILDTAEAVSSLSTLPSGTFSTLGQR
jgi:predicted aldo/keto reductase-like oxidoreductase